MARVVLDTFAPYAYFAGEPAAADVESLLRMARAGEHRLYMAMFNVGEVVYKLWREVGEQEASDALFLIDQWPMDIIQADSDLVLTAASVKAQHRMGYLDCFPVALAMRLNALVATGDSGFRAVEDLVTVQWLPRA